LVASRKSEKEWKKERGEQSKKIRTKDRGRIGGLKQRGSKTSRR